MQKLHKNYTIITFSVNITSFLCEILRHFILKLMDVILQQEKFPDVISLNSGKHRKVWKDSIPFLHMCNIFFILVLNCFKVGGAIFPDFTVFSKLQKHIVIGKYYDDFDDPIFVSLL